LFCQQLLMLGHILSASKECYLLPTRSEFLGPAKNKLHAD
jgi:hypothetical protein